MPCRFATDVATNTQAEAEAEASHQFYPAVLVPNDPLFCSFSVPVVCTFIGWDGGWVGWSVPMVWYFAREALHRLVTRELGNPSFL